MTCGWGHSLEPVSKVNFLKYSEFWWAFFVKNKISYHNRLREKQFFEIFRQYGAKIIWSEHQVDPADVELLKTMPIHNDFKGMTIEELAPWRTELIYSFS